MHMQRQFVSACCWKGSCEDWRGYKSLFLPQTASGRESDGETGIYYINEALTKRWVLYEWQNNRARAMSKHSGSEYMH